MAATVIIEELNGVGEIATDKTSGTVRFKSADNATVDTNDRLIIPAVGQTYSYEKWFRTRITVAPAVDIQALEVYMDGSKGWPAGVKIWFATIGAFDGTNGPTKPNEGNDPPLGPDDATAMTDAFTYTNVSPLSLETVNAGPFSSVGQIGDYLVAVMEVEPGTPVGLLTAEDLTIRFKES